MEAIRRLAEAWVTCHHLHRHPQGGYGSDHHSKVLHSHEQPQGLDFQTRSSTEGWDHHDDDDDDNDDDNDDKDDNDGDGDDDDDDDGDDDDEVRLKAILK